eukprot:jgi/Ulvmu1/5223/UM022_0016.1
MQSLRRLAIDAALNTAHQSRYFICGNVGVYSCLLWRPDAVSSSQVLSRQGRPWDGWTCHPQRSHERTGVICPTTPLQSGRHLSTHLASLSRQQPDDVGESCIESQRIYTVSNAISMSRLLSAPGIAWLIASEQWQLSLAAVTVAGISDLLDGYVAKTFNQHSVVGSYLDPLADKAVLCACFGALGWNGALPSKLVTVVLSRDALLVLAHFYHRATVLKWQVSSVQQFFQTTAVSGSPAAERVQPLLVGKISTFVQFALVGACVLSGALDVPENKYTEFLMLNTYMWTVGSGVAYLLTCSWIKRSDKAVMLVSGLTFWVASYCWPA